MKNYLLTIATIVVTSFMAINLAFASDVGQEQRPIDPRCVDKPKVFTLDNEAALIWDFTNMAIVRDLWLEDTGREPYANVEWFKRFWHYEHQKEMNSVKQAKRWNEKLAEFIFRKDGLPKAFAVNKWEDEITLAFHWTGDFEEINGEDKYKYNFAMLGNEPPDFSSSIYVNTEEKIRNLLPRIKNLLKKKASFKTLDQEKENTKIQASLRIVLDDYYLNSRTYVPVPYRCTNEGRSVEMSNFNPIARTASKFVTGVPFQLDYADNEMDGYLIPEADNSIGFTACVMHPDAFEDNPQMLKTCLIKALGLPGQSKIEEEFDVIDMEGWEPQSDGFFTPYEEVMLKLLYCDRVKAGMDIYQVIDALKGHTKECLKQE